MEIEDIFSLGELFERVQVEQIFPDGKTFVDCIPKSSLASIRDRYAEEKNMKNFSLSIFVNANFDLPLVNSSEYNHAACRPISEHINLLWNELSRQPDKKTSSLIPLPYLYVVPGGRFREIYYWDSYFTMLGLQISGRVDLIQNMVDNFSYLIEHIGYIPNGNRTYYIGRSQPPFYACMVKLLREEKGDSVLIDYLPQLEKEYLFWMKGSNLLNLSNPLTHRVSLLSKRNILNHYWDENDTPRPESFREDVELAHDTENKEARYRNLRAAAESGWDFSSRWFKDVNDFSSIHTTEIIPVDLNCLLFNLEKTIAEAYRLLKNEEQSLKFELAAKKRQECINHYCWNDVKGFYFDYDYVQGEQKQSYTLAATFPLFFEIASKEQAAMIANVLEEKFVFPGGLITTTETTTQQWDAPNGWAPLQWIAIKGLLNYGYDELAKDIAKRWMNINEKVYNNTGKMMEKYNVVATNLEAGGGEYPAQDGFGWTNGVYLALEKFLAKYS
ncbi:MAG: alpha,alpha-trehalase TreF [Bacteroidota bacterium]|nr:alpha,alpha-trehalase TreF [Bacteroidota bacterium]